MNQITFSELSIEARTEAIKESLESTLWSLERSEQQIETLRRLLEEQKKAVGHGKWLKWVRENLGDSDATIQKIQRFMREPKKSLVTYLPDSNKSNLTYLDGEQEGSEEQAIVPREERKPAEVQVRKVEPDGNKVPAEPKTNTAYSKENRKASEAERTPPPVVTPEIVVEPEKDVHKLLAEESAQVRLNFAIREVSQVLGKIAEESERRAAAKQLRKLADELDPPTQKPSRAAFTPPSVDQVREYVHSINGKTDPETFCDFYTSKDWLVGKVKMKDWKAAVRTWEKGRDNKQGASALRGDEW